MKKRCCSVSTGSKGVYSSNDAFPNFLIVLIQQILTKRLQCGKNYIRGWGHSGEEADVILALTF